MNLSLYVTGLIGEPEDEYYAYDWTTSQEIKEEIDESSNIESIDLYLNSIGGNAQHGFDMIKHIESTGIKPTVYIQGLAASMASYMAAYFKNRGSEVYAYEDSEVMYHSSASSRGGTAKELFKMAQSAEKFDSEMADEYAKAFGKDKETILSEMEEETWLDSSDLINLGFATFTENFSSLVAKVRNENIYNRQQKQRNMDYTKIAAAMGEDVDSGESALVAKAKKLKSTVSDLEATLKEVKSDKEALQAKIDTANDEIKSYKEKTQKSEATSLIAKFEGELERKLADTEDAQSRATRYALKAVTGEGTDKEDAEFALKSFIKAHGAPMKEDKGAGRETDNGNQDAFEKLQARCEKEGIPFEEGFKKYGLGGKK